MATDVHSVRFYNAETCAVKCMSCDDDSGLLAVARCDNTIEVWNLQHSPHLERTIGCTYDPLGIESLAWYNKRLFSGGLGKSVIEYDLFRQEPKSMYPVTSGVCWCIAVKKESKQLAAGTDAGYINIFNITDDYLEHHKLLDRQEGRITCIAWDASGEYLVTGSIDTLRVWNAEKGLAIHRMTTGRNQAKVETLVTSLVVTNDFTIISGDSRGKLCFWDGKAGLGIDSFQSHQADVLAVCLSQDQNTVYCAGRDPLIASYDRVKIREGDRQAKWVKSIQRVIHDHDVRALVTCGKRLFSAGVDGYIALSSYPPRVLHKYPSLPQAPVAWSSGSERLLLLRYPSHLCLYRLASSKSSPPSGGPAKLLQWEPGFEGRIKCSALSQDGRWMACSTSNRFRLYSLRIVDNTPRLTRHKLPTKESLISHVICFSRDSTRLVLGTVEGCLVIVDLSSGTPALLSSHQAYKNKDITDSISALAVSSDSEFVIASDLDSNIIVWQKDKVYSKLPRYSCPITALAVQPHTNELVIVYADHKVMEYSLKKRKYTKFSKTLQDQYPKQWLSRNFPILNITFDERNDNIILFHDDSTIFVINKEKELPDVEAKIPRMGSYNDENSSSETGSHHPFSTTPQHAFHVIKKYKHLVYFGELCEGEMIAVEVSPVKLLEKLPPTLKQKRFGKM